MRIVSRCVFSVSFNYFSGINGFGRLLKRRSGLCPMARYVVVILETARRANKEQAARLRNHDIRLLEAWYAQKSKNASSPSYLVLMIHDFEAFDIQLFQNLTSILRYS